MDQSKYDTECPPGFQTAEFLQKHGQLDIVLNEESELDETVGTLLNILFHDSAVPNGTTEMPKRSTSSSDNSRLVEELETLEHDYLHTRSLDRYQPQDIIAQVFDEFIELSGDGKVGFDKCIRGGLAKLDGKPCVVFGTTKGHNPMHMKDANFGMASPHGYRFALKLMQLAEHFRFPVFTLVDTVGAYPSFDSETNGQSEALATNLIKMASLSVPIISLIVGEGGSGGALGIAMGNRIGMLSKAYYAVISPEGASSILGKYVSEEQKAIQFPIDCRQLALLQKVFAVDLLKLGAIDEVLLEVDGENYQHFPILTEKIRNFFLSSLNDLIHLSPQVELFNFIYSFFHLFFIFLLTTLLFFLFI
jgi:acetyl-CoA carboxylase carboxyl transferase alpha subunit